MTRSKKSGRVLFEQAGPALVLGQSLINGEIHFAAFDDFAGFDLVPRVAEGGEDPILGLIHEYVAVGEVEVCGAAGTRPSGSSGLTTASSKFETRQRFCRCLSP